MDDWSDVLKKFIIQAQGSDLKTASYPKEWADLRMRVSFGMGMPARVPWIAFIAPEMAVSKGFYPVYLYYKQLETIILAYGISETKEFGESWPVEIMNTAQTISSFFDENIPRYGDSFVFKAYKVDQDNSTIKLTNPVDDSELTKFDIESDLSNLIDYYKKVVSLPTSTLRTEIRHGLFYMEKQLQDFLIQNWENTELGKMYDLIIEDGDLISQQFRTDIGLIDILVKEKETNDFVVIELKKDQTSDDTVGQIARYMGWIKENKKVDNVKGVIIAGQFDKKLEYAISIVPNIDIYIYEVDFKLTRIE